MQVEIQIVAEVNLILCGISNRSITAIRAVYRIPLEFRKYSRVKILPLNLNPKNEEGKIIIEKKVDTIKHGFCK